MHVKRHLVPCQIRVIMALFVINVMCDQISITLLFKHRHVHHDMFCYYIAHLIYIYIYQSQLV